MLRDREVLSRDGFVVAIVQRDSETGQVHGRPEIITRGFVFEREAEDLLAGAEEAVLDMVKNNGFNGKALRESQRRAGRVSLQADQAQADGDSGGVGVIGN